MKISTLTRAVFAALAVFAFAPFAEAELITTPSGVWDTDDSEVKVNYNVKTDDGVETRSTTVRTSDVSDKNKVNALAKKLSAGKLIISPTDTNTLTETRTVFSYRKTDPKETPPQVRVRRYYTAKTQIQAETRNFYKSRIPGAIAPMGQFINESGGSMAITDKNKKPLGALIISYKTDIVPLPITEADREESFPNSKVPLLKNADFFIVGAIPSEWEEGSPADLTSPESPGTISYRLPNGNYVMVKAVRSTPVKDGKVYRCYSYVLRTSITYNYERLKK